MSGKWKEIIKTKILQTQNELLLLKLSLQYFLINFCSVWRGSIQRHCADAASKAHHVLVLLAEAAQLPLEVNANPDVQVSTVANVWHHPEKATNFFVLLGGDGVLQVEECLFPVSVSGIGSRWETNGLLAFREFDVEEDDDCLKNVLTSDSF